MSMRAKLASLLTTLFLAAVGNIALTGLLERYTVEKLEWITHTHQVLAESERLLSSLTDAETGQRGYLLTRDSEYLEPYYKGISDSKKHFQTLSTLTKDNPNQKKRLETINVLMKQKFNELGLTIHLIQENKPSSFEKAVNIVKGNVGKNYMDALRLKFIALNNEERALLKRRVDEYNSAKTYILMAFVGEIIFLVLLAIVTLIFIKNRLYSPLEMLIDGASKIEKGERQKTPDFLPNDEMGYLLSRFYRMSESIYAKTKALAYDADHDALTGLYNRSKMDQEIKDSISSLTNNHKIAVLFIDLDEFKSLNDTLGHDVGDAILKETAKRLNVSVRDSDVTIRVGGDEFVAIVKDITQKSDVQIVLDKILSEFAAPFTYKEHTLQILPSIGVAVSPDDSTNSKKILKLSDIAMYAAKQDKEATYKFFDKSMLKRESDKR